MGNAENSENNNKRRLTKAGAMLVAGLSAMAPSHSADAQTSLDKGHSVTVAPSSDYLQAAPIKEADVPRVRERLNNISQLLGVTFRADTIDKLKSSAEVDRIIGQAGIVATMRQNFIAVQGQWTIMQRTGQLSSHDIKNIEEDNRRIHEAFKLLQGMPIGKHMFEQLEKELNNVRKLRGALLERDI
jgi:hypothetical protein